MLFIFRWKGNDHDIEEVGGCLQEDPIKIKGHVHIFLYKGEKKSATENQSVAD